MNVMPAPAADGCDNWIGLPLPIVAVPPSTVSVVMIRPLVPMTYCCPSIGPVGRVMLAAVIVPGLIIIV